jgi:hypothetical protein
MYDGFGSVQPASALIMYSDGSTSTGNVYADCSAVPSPTRKLSGKTLALDQHTCACADPRANLPSPP